MNASLTIDGSNLGKTIVLGESIALGRSIVLGYLASDSIGAHCLLKDKDAGLDLPTAELVRGGRPLAA
jgi:hypothetical protein